MARKHPQVIAHHATSAANNPQPLPRRYQGRRQLTHEQLAERGVRRSPRVQPLSLLGGALRLSRAEQAALETALFRDAPLLRPPGDHARPVAWTLIRRHAR